jgi:hypothetical protein
MIRNGRHDEVIQNVRRPVGDDLRLFAKCNKPLASKSGPLHIVGGFGAFAGVPNFDDVQVHRVGEVSLALGRVGLVWWIGRHSNTRPRTA